MFDTERDKCQANWLQLSDLHVFDEAATDLMLRSFEMLATKISPQFIVVTGDFRHLQLQTSYVNSKHYLEEIIRLFHITKENVFLIPGNHDVNMSANLQREEAISQIVAHTEDKYTVYSEYRDSLFDAFTEYEEFARDFYKNSSVKDERITSPAGVFCINWNGKLNLFHTNTALISDGKKNADGERCHPEILDINAVAKKAREMLDSRVPTIMLGHHGLKSLYTKHREYLEETLRSWNFSAYLHGDIHKYANAPIIGNIPNTSIPELACGKSAPQAGDAYSDIGVLYYSWKQDNKVYVNAYNWDGHGFIKNNCRLFTHNIDQEYYFQMHYDSNATSEKNTEKDYLNKVEIDNCVFFRRDSIDYGPKDLKDLYTIPVFSEQKPIMLIGGKLPIRLIITSPSGYGKSSFLQSFALVNAVSFREGLENVDEAYRYLYSGFGLSRSFFPIIVRATKFTASEEPEKRENANQLLHNAFYGISNKKVEAPQELQLLERKCQTGEAILLIDSFDEVEEELAGSFIQLINNFVHTYPNTSIILTSRSTTGLRDIQNNGFYPVKLEPFEDTQIKDQIKKRVLNATDRERIEGIIFANPYMHDMAHNPLMLTEMIFRMEKSSSISVVELLGSITESIIQQRWRDMETIDADMLEDLLARIAWKQLAEDAHAKIERSRVGIEFSEAYESLQKSGWTCQLAGNEEDIRKRFQELAKSMFRRSGILNLEDNGLYYVFQDDIIKWYLAAKHFIWILGKSESIDIAEYEIIRTIEDNICMQNIEEPLIHVLVMSFFYLARRQQRALLTYMLVRGTYSTKWNEIAVMAEGFLDLFENTFSTNKVLNELAYGINLERLCVGRWIVNNVIAIENGEGSRIIRRLHKVAPQLVDDLNRAGLIRCDSKECVGQI